MIRIHLEFTLYTFFFLHTSQDALHIFKNQERGFNRDEFKDKSLPRRFYKLQPKNKLVPTNPTSFIPT